MLRPGLKAKDKKRLKELLGKAEVALGLGRMDVLEHLCGQIELLAPEHVDALHYRGVIALQSGKVEQAVDHMRKAVERSPKCYVYCINLGAALLLQGDAAGALLSYKQAAVLNRRDISAQLGCADSYMALQQALQAVQILKPLLLKFPADISLNMRCFRAYYAAALPDEGRVCLLNVLATDADHAGAHYGLALLAVAAGQFEDAEKEVLAVLASSPEHVDAYKLLADVHSFSARDEHLSAMLELHERLDGASRATLSFALGKVFHGLKQYERAFIYYNEANSLRRQTLTYDHGIQLSRMRNMMAFPGGGWATAGQGAVPVEQPSLY